jgi:hypothetical protein
MIIILAEGRWNWYKALVQGLKSEKLVQRASMYMKRAKYFFREQKRQADRDDVLQD